MAIIATYNQGDITISNAYVKIDNIWGNKVEGWNARAVVIGDTHDQLATFHISCQYNDGENPFTGLYLAMDNLSFLSNINHDVKKKKTRPKL